MSETGLYKDHLPRNTLSFSNLHPVSLKIDDVSYNGAEQRIQSEKTSLFNDDITQAKIMAETNPYKIKKLDSRVRNFSSDKWHKHDKHIVFTAVREKFLQNPFLKAIVLNAGSAKIAESSIDTYWGTGIHLHDESALDECF